MIDKDILTELQITEEDVRKGAEILDVKGHYIDKHQTPYDDMDSKNKLIWKKICNEFWGLTPEEAEAFIDTRNTYVHEIERRKFGDILPEWGTPKHYEWRKFLGKLKIKF